MGTLTLWSRIHNDPPPPAGQQLSVDIESDTEIKLDWLQECMLQVPCVCVCVRVCTWMGVRVEVSDMYVIDSNVICCLPV